MLLWTFEVSKLKSYSDKCISCNCAIYSNFLNFQQPPFWKFSVNDLDLNFDKVVFCAEYRILEMGFSSIIDIKNSWAYFTFTSCTQPNQRHLTPVHLRTPAPVSQLMTFDSITFPIIIIIGPPPFPASLSSRNCPRWWRRTALFVTGRTGTVRWRSDGENTDGRIMKMTFCAASTPADAPSPSGSNRARFTGAAMQMPYNSFGVWGKMCLMWCEGKYWRGSPRKV